MHLSKVSPDGAVVEAFEERHGFDFVGGNVVEVVTDRGDGGAEPAAVEDGKPHFGARESDIIDTGIIIAA